MRACDVDLLLARAQVALAVIFSFGFFGLLFLLIVGPKRDMTAQEITIITSMLSVLGTLLATILGFFFARQRPHAGVLPDPNTTSTTTTTTTTKTPPTSGSESSLG